MYFTFQEIEQTIQGFKFGSANGEFCQANKTTETRIHRAISHFRHSQLTEILVEYFKYLDTADSPLWNQLEFKCICI